MKLSIENIARIISNPNGGFSDDEIDKLILGQYLMVKRTALKYDLIFH